MQNKMPISRTCGINGVKEADGRKGQAAFAMLAPRRPRWRVSPAKSPQVALSTTAGLANASDATASLERNGAEPGAITKSSNKFCYKEFIKRV